MNEAATPAELQPSFLLRPRRDDCEPVLAREKVIHEFDPRLTANAPGCCGAPTGALVRCSYLSVVVSRFCFPFPKTLRRRTSSSFRVPRPLSERTRERGGDQ